MTDTCIVHLVWKPLGPEPLRDFVESYKRNPGGVGHHLVVAFNGFKDEAELGKYRDILTGVEHEWFRVWPPVQDIPVYFMAAEKFSYRYFCFLNSYSVILDEAWLTKMHTHLMNSDRVGLVGATGSYESYYTNLAIEHKPYSTSRFLLRRLAHDLPLLYQDYQTYAHFAPLPNYHVRTNGFMLARKVMLHLKARRLRTKMDCFKFESGREGMTHQIMRMGLNALVVGRNGRAYEKEQWFESGTFRSHGQHNLLIADNHTRRYSEADEYDKRMMEQITWGNWRLRDSAVTAETSE